MDLERIKQNFRIRSGRTRKPRKHHKPKTSQTSPQLPNGTSGTAASQKEQSLSKQDTESPSDSSPKSEKTTPNTSPGDEGKESAQDIDSHSDAPTSSDQPAEDNSSPLRSRSPSIRSEASSLDLPRPTDQPDDMPDAQNANEAAGSEVDDFDLAPPTTRRAKPPSIETLSELLFSPGHLDCLLQNPPQLARFSAFLQRYSPEHYPLLAQYLETRKAIKAVEYANAVAEGFKPKQTGGDISTEKRTLAATLDPEFEAICNSSFEALMNDALPGFISYSLIKIASECMTNEITGRATPIMRDLVDGLSEVFCLTDPNQEDNPIIYASEEFYRFTRYGPDDVLNNNCRFLQGRKTNPISPKRLKNAITAGEEISETLLNYKRDGRPFINLLMVAPLHDRNGKLKYHIGAQIDVSGLVEGGRALGSFQRYLARRGDEQRREEIEKAQQDLGDDQKRKKRALARLRDLSESFDMEETAVVQAASRASSLTRDDDDNRSVASLDRQKGQRRVYLDSEASDYEDGDGAGDGKGDDADWKLGDAGDGRLSGKLPGVYDSFILFRPAPSFRIVFVSPKLRKISNAIQTPFLSHIAAPSGTLNGLTESLRSGVPVAAKVHFTPERGERRDGTRLKSGTKHEDGKNGQAIWVSCTPLLGEDDTIGVWMCVVVEKSKIGPIKKKRGQDLENMAEEMGKASARGSPKADKAGQAGDSTPTKNKDIPIRPVRVDSDTVIKAQAEKSPESAEAGQDQSSKAVRPQTSMYFDAEQDNDIDEDKAPERQDSDGSDSGGGRTVTGNNSPTLAPAQDQDPRAVMTPVKEYEDEEKDSTSYAFDTPDSRPQIEDRDEDDDDNDDDEYIATHSPAMKPQNFSDRALIEEDSDGLADSDLDHHRENIQVGRGRPRSSSGASLNSPASDIPPSVPSSAMIGDDGEEEHESEGENNEESSKATKDEDENDKNKMKSGDDSAVPNEDTKTPTMAQHGPPATPPNADEEDDNENLEESHVTIKPSQEQSPGRDSNKDSAISLDSPAQPKRRARSRSGSRSHSPHAGSTSEKSEYPDEDEKQSTTPKHLEPWLSDAESLPSHNRDVEHWVTEGARPSASRENSNRTEKASHDHDHSHSHAHKPSNVTVTGTGRGVSGLRLDFLGTGETRWATRQPRRRFDADFGDDDDDEGGAGGGPEDYFDDGLEPRSDHCATSPYSVD